MQTYLDGYIKGLKARSTAIMAACGLAPAREPRDDGEALLMLGAAVEVGFPTLRDVEAAAQLDPRLPEYLRFVTHAALVVAEPSEPGAPGPLRVALSGDLAKTLSGGGIGPAVAEAFRAVQARQPLIYLDIAPGGLVIRETAQVRAVIARRDRQGTLICAVLTPPGSERGVRLWWREGERDPRGRLWSGPAPGRAFEQALRDTSIEIDAVLQAVEDLLCLGVVHATTLPEAGTELPHVPAGDLRRRGPRARQTAKKYALFRIRRMEAPADRFGRPAAAGNGGGGSPLTIRQPVRGHFKLQAHGPGRARRKLIFVESYERGPENARRRGPLEVPGAATDPTRGTAAQGETGSPREHARRDTPLGQGMPRSKARRTTRA